MLYNSKERSTILKHKSSNPTYVLKMLEEYLSVYPSDYIASSSYADVLITLGQLEEAEKLLDFISEKLDQFEASDRLIVNFLDVKLRLLIFQEKYEEAITLFDKYYRGDSKLKLKSKMDDIKGLFSSYCLTKLGRESEIEDNKVFHLYSYQQIFDYSEERLLSHISKHEGGNFNNNSSDNSLFYENFPLEEDIKEIKELDLKDKKLYGIYFSDIYYFKYTKNGISKEKETADYFKVVMAHNTKNIISMYPVQIGQFLPYFDLDYLNKNKDSDDKKLSRIDKFNQKYKKFLK